MPGGGGLLQLVAQGKQDVFLTGNPQITWFKMVYRRYTNFAMESQQIVFDGDPDFGKRVTALVPRRGDLLGPIIMEVVLPYVEMTDGTSGVYVNSTGYSLIEEISLEIGEQEIDKQTGEWMEIWSSLSTPAGQKDALDNIIGRVDGLNRPPTVIPPQTCSVGGYKYGAVKLYIPLQFWFNKNPGLYLPLLAMQYHPIRINMKIRDLNGMLSNTNLSSSCSNVQPKPAKIVDLRLWGDYVYLDTEERRRFVANTHEYLIEQVQYTPKVSIPEGVNIHNVRLEFNHPLRELIWVLQRDVMETTHEWFNFGSTSAFEAGISRDILQDATLQVDGYDRFDTRDSGYFRLVQPYQYHTSTDVKKFIYVYSFSLRPEEMQPSGSLNASRIDNMNLMFNLRPDSNEPQTLTIPVLDQNGAPVLVNGVAATQTIANPAYVPNRGKSHIVVYAKNHNVLRVVNGFAGLLFKI
jgi:Major capsid protein N-terminus/Large eukaryotic DNA virus major capsid protein